MSTNLTHDLPVLTCPTRGMASLPRVFLLVVSWFVLLGPVGAIRDANRACADSARPVVVRQNTTDRLQALRQRMLAKGASAYIIPAQDSHQRTDFIAPADRRTEFISGFSGAAGAAVMLSNKALLWMKYRHWSRAEAEVDENWHYGESSPELWIISNHVLSSDNFTVMANAELVSAATWLEYQQRFDSYGIKLADDGRMLDTLWESMPGMLRRPPATNNELHVIDMKFSGRSWEEKVYDIQRELRGQADLLVVTDLDDISWLFNVRGGDVDYRPLFFAYAIVPATGYPRLYLRDRDSRLRGIASHLRCDSSGRCRPGERMCTEVYPYENVFADIRSLSSQATNISISPKSSYKIYNQVDQGKRIVDLPLIKHFRMMRNPTEVQGIRNSHLRDSAVIVELLATLENELQANKSWSEIDVSRQLDVIRRKYDYYQGPSFPAVVGYGPNGAKTNHVPTCATNLNISTDSLLLLDTGGHYLDGTTDIARTFHFGTPTKSQKSSYTWALERVVSQAMLSWPVDRSSDSLPLQDARATGTSGWELKTRHGITVSSSIIDGPSRMSHGDSKPATAGAIYEGMLYSEELGEYQEGEFGARLDSTVLTFQQNKSSPPQANAVYMGFEPIVFVPFELKLIAASRLSHDKVKWINEYHKQCLEKVGSILRARNLEIAHNWLRARTVTLTGVSCVLNARLFFVIFAVLLQLLLRMWLH